MSLNRLDPTFVKSLEFLQPKLDRLICMRPYYGNLPNCMPRHGIYLFSEKEGHWYIGTSGSLLFLGSEDEIQRLRRALGQRYRGDLRVDPALKYLRDPVS